MQVVNKIVTQALRDRASDVHLEPAEDCVRVRFRVDGALNEVVELPSEMGQALVSRIKIMADMNIVERRRPQDGQFEMNIDGRDLDVRVSTTSTIWGEKTVLRLLDRTRSLYALGDLGMPPDSEALYSRIVNSPYGMIIVGGPTGSGKTTTLYATLSEINRPDINVMTIEDPVEYIFNKVNQIQISESAGMTFATGLKSILRQDPDVILVGEVRDVETARIAVQSALTGHRVFSSVHAIDAVSSLYRLLDMGIEPFLITSAIVGVVAQRLTRRICASCATPFEPLTVGRHAVPEARRPRQGRMAPRQGLHTSAPAPATSTGSACTKCWRSRTRSANASSRATRRRWLGNSRSRRVYGRSRPRRSAWCEADVTTMEEVVKHVVVGEEYLMSTTLEQHQPHSVHTRRERHEEGVVQARLLHRPAGQARRSHELLAPDVVVPARRRADPRLARSVVAEENAIEEDAGSARRHAAPPAGRLELRRRGRRPHRESFPATTSPSCARPSSPASSTTRSSSSPATSSARSKPGASSRARSRTRRSCACSRSRP